jgi:hypothetical protein
MPNKTFNVGFYQIEYGDNETTEIIHDYFKGWSDESTGPAEKLKSDYHELRNLQNNNNKIIYGEFVKFRDSDLPHIGELGNKVEHEIGLEEREGLIEKNYFIYYKRYNLIVYQQNGNGSTANQFGQYLTQVTGETTVLQPILEPGAMARLMKKDMKPKYLEVSFAKPKNKDIIPNDLWTKDVFSMLNNSGGNNAFIRVSLGQGSRGRFLNQSVKKSIKELMRHTDVKIARLKVDEDGIEHPIDLIADRIKSTITVQMRGRYPVRHEVFQELKSSYNEQKKAIISVLGGSGALA